MRNPNKSSNSATGNSAAPSPVSPPPNPTSFDSSSQSSQNFQNGFYKHPELDPRLAVGMGMSPPPFSLFPANVHTQLQQLQQQPQTTFPGPLPMHPMNIFSMSSMNNFNLFQVPSTSTANNHQRSPSFPIVPGTQPQPFPVHPFNNNSNGATQAGQDQTTVNPQLISSPTLDSSWMQHQGHPYFSLPSQNPPVGFQSPYLNDPRSLPPLPSPPQQGSGFSPLFTSHEETFDGVNKNGPDASAGTSHTQESPTQHNANSDSKNTSDRSGSNDTSLQCVSNLLSTNSFRGSHLILPPPFYFYLI